MVIIPADVANPQAMKRLREIKKRSEDKPFSILISQRGLISNYTSISGPALYKLIYNYWPGPLTVIVPCVRALSSACSRVSIRSFRSGDFIKPPDGTGVNLPAP